MNCRSSKSSKNDSRAPTEDETEAAEEQCCQATNNVKNMENVWKSLSPSSSLERTSTATTTLTTTTSVVGDDHDGENDEDGQIDTDDTDDDDRDLIVRSFSTTTSSSSTSSSSGEIIQFHDEAEHGQDRNDDEGRNDEAQD